MSEGGPAVRVSAPGPKGTDGDVPSSPRTDPSSHRPLIRRFLPVLCSAALLVVGAGCSGNDQSGSNSDGGTDPALTGEGTITGDTQLPPGEDVELPGETPDSPGTD